MKKRDHKRKKGKRDSFNLDEITTAIDEHFYMLVGREPVRCSLADYAQFMKVETKRVLAQNMVGNLHVSTIFTGIDQNFGRGPRILFETVVFGLPNDLHPQWRYSTWDEAMENHQRLLDSVTEHGIQYLQEEIRKTTESER